MKEEMNNCFSVALDTGREQAASQITQSPSLYLRPCLSHCLKLVVTRVGRQVKVVACILLFLSLPLSFSWCQYAYCLLNTEIFLPLALSFTNFTAKLEAKAEGALQVVVVATATVSASSTYPSVFFLLVKKIVSRLLKQSSWHPAR